MWDFYEFGIVLVVVVICDFCSGVLVGIVSIVGLILCMFDEWLGELVWLVINVV